MAEPAPTRAGFVAIIGAPNVGKSTLLNQLVGTKVSIVSPKVQTTRRRVIGITIVGTTQVLFVDTPGIFAPKRRLETAMVKAASAGIADADLVLLVLDVKKGLTPTARSRSGNSRASGGERYLVINKIDTAAVERALPLIAAVNGRSPSPPPSSSPPSTATAARTCWRRWPGSCPKVPGCFPRTSSPTSRTARSPPRSRASRSSTGCTRSCPTASPSRPRAGRNRRWQEVRIDQTIYVLRDSQKPILIGRKGQQLKAWARPPAPSSSDPRQARPPVPVRQGARELAGRPRALPRDGAGFPALTGFWFSVGQQR